MTDILTRLKTVWPADYALQPSTPAERMCVIEIQQLKIDAIAEIERLNSKIDFLLKAK